MGVPTSIPPKRAPGGLYAVLFIDGVAIDEAPLIDEVTDVGGVAISHAGVALRAWAVGSEALVAIYDGDTGQFVMALGRVE